ncbi:MAG: TonB-dependent receptor [Alphaproteobacteria bacterium]|nr:TonB-dependent receptor [Alphaproteobacteria bacterium]
MRKNDERRAAARASGFDRARAMRGVCLAAVATALGAGGLATGALAQATDEIVVNAQKREQTLQDLPVSGTVISEEEILDFGGFTDDTELGQFLTGVEVEDIGNTEYFIRGANSAGTTPFARSAVTQLLNGAEVAGGFAGRSFERMDLFDTQQIAVFRGTQGALYGRGAIGGVINQVSNKPKNFFEYRATTSWNVTQDEGRFDGIINIPIVKNRLLFRGGIAWQDGDGYLRNDFRESGVNGLEFTGGRTAFRYFFNEKVDATLIVDYGEASVDDLLHGAIDATLPGERLNVNGAPIAPDGTPIPLGPPTAAGFTGSVGYPAQAPGDFEHQAYDSPTFYEENTFTSNLTVNFELPFGVGTSITGIRSRAYEVLLDDDGTYKGGVLRVGLVNECSFYPGGLPPVSRINGSIFDGGIGMYQSGDLEGFGGPPFTAGSFVNTMVITAADFPDLAMCETTRLADTSIFTQEFRIQSDPGARLSWLVGTDGRMSYQNQTRIQENRNPTFLIQDPMNPAILRTATFADVVNNDAGSELSNFRQDTDLLESHVALFGNVGYFVTDWLQAALSLRYTYERISQQTQFIDQDRYRSFIGPGTFAMNGIFDADGAGGTYTDEGTTGTFINNTNFGQVIIDRDDAAVYQSIIPSLTLTARAPGEWIYYASWGQGFKPGGFNDVGGSIMSGLFNVDRQYGEEWANSYELGVKKTFRLGNGSFRFSAVAFRVEYNDRLRVLTVTEDSDLEDPTDLEPTDQFTTQVIVNSGDGYVQGVEVDAGGLVRNFMDLGGRLTYSAGLTFGESRYTSGAFEGTNTQFGGVSTWSGRANLTYRRALPFLENSGIGLFLNTNYAFGVNTDAPGRGVDTRKTWNLRGGIEGETAGQGWQLQAFWDNWTDIQYERSRGALFGAQTYAGVEPSNWGLRLTVTGGER